VTANSSAPTPAPGSPDASEAGAMPALEAPNDVVLRLLVWTSRASTAALGLVGLVGLGVSALMLAGRGPDAVASALPDRLVATCVTAAVLAMVAGAARAGGIERRRYVARVRAQLAADAAQREAFRAREAARLAAEAQAAAEAVAAKERSARLAAEAAERAAALKTDEAAHQGRDSQEALLERALAEKERREREERIERAIRDGGRVA
jgi:hypothetical protein